MNISQRGCDKNNISIGEVLLLLSIYNKVDLTETQNSLINRGFITANRDPSINQDWILTRKGCEILDSVILDSDIPSNEERLNNLSLSLKNIFPKGKKDGTSYYWADGVVLISRRLKLFFKKYGDTYTDEQIIKAAEDYVNSFNGNYKYMKLLKYFILKEKVGAGGDVEGESELINYIENSDQEDLIKNDWDTTLK